MFAIPAEGASVCSAPNLRPWHESRLPASRDDVELIRQWVHENIERSDFGAGDPNRVVLSGQSSGAVHVATNSAFSSARPALTAQLIDHIDSIRCRRPNSLQ